MRGHACNVLALVDVVLPTRGQPGHPIGLHGSDFAVILLLVRQPLLQGVPFRRNLGIKGARVSFRIDRKRCVSLRRELPDGFLGLLANLRQGLRLLNLAVTHAD